MTEKKVPKELDAIADTVLAYRPKARSKPAVQRKRRKTILEKKCPNEPQVRATCPKCFAILRCDHPLARAAPWRCACCGLSFYVSFWRHK